ncbi:MAG TPA: DUF4328 domain-containing protein [Gemmatimonadales bacterium]|nr:DUF4328 domain-containing protein [Gemmatimonadales bacterium]
MAAFLPSGPRALRVTVALYLCLLLSALGAASAFSQWHLLGQVLEGQPLSTEVARANDGRHLALTAGLAAMMLVTALLYFNWLYNSVRNVAEVRGKPTTVTQGWAIGYWFIPIINLYRPYRTMVELWEKSSQGIAVKMLPPPIALWWLTYLLGGGLDGSTTRLVEAGMLRLSAGLEVAGKLLLVVAAYLLIRIISAIDAAQAQWPD